MTFHKYSKIYRLGHQETEGVLDNPEDRLVIQEKMDGANFRIYITQEGEVILGSRRAQLTEDGEHDYQSNFEQCIKHVLEALEDKNLGPWKGLILYGECMHKHTLPYNWDEVPQFLGFDVRTTSGSYWDWSEAKQLFEKLGLETVPTLYEGTVGDFLSEKADDQDLDEFLHEQVPVTQWPPKAKSDLLAEGLAIKNESKKVYTKYVRPEFKEANAIVFGNTPNHHEEGFASKLANKYGTSARIEKHIYKLLDEGHDLEMPLMEHLPMRVWKDIWEEEWYSIIMEDASHETIDVKQARKNVTKNCLTILKSMITNNALQCDSDE